MLIQSTTKSQKKT